MKRLEIPILLPRDFAISDMETMCVSIRRSLDDIWHDAIDLTKGDAAECEVESNKEHLNQRVLDLLTSLHCLEGYIGQIDKAEFEAQEAIRRAVSQAREVSPC